MEEVLKHSWVQRGCGRIPSFVNEDQICFPCGSFIKFLNTKNGTQMDYLFPGEGIGILTADMQLNVIAVSELTTMPKIYIMESTSLRIIETLEGGTQLEYLYLSFAFNEFLLSLGSVPDFKLSLWRWTTQEILCSIENHLPSQILSKKLLPVQISVNPLTYKKLCMTYPESVIFFEVEQYASKYLMNKYSCTLPVEGEITLPFYTTDNDIPKLNLFLNIDNINSKNMLIETLAQVPLSASIGMPDNMIRDFFNHTYGKHQVVPTCHCWLNNNDILVGCRDGSILQINSKNCNTYKAYSISWPETEERQEDGPITSMALHKVGLYLAGRGGVVMIMKVKVNELECLYSFSINQTIGNINFSSTYQQMCIWGVQGSIYICDMINPFSSKNPMNVWDKDLQNIVGIGCFRNMEAYYIIVKENGTVQQWNLENGSLKSEFNIEQNASCSACSPLCPLLVIATMTGFLYFYDMTDFEKRRLVRIFRLFTEPIPKIQFDNNGEYLTAVGKNNKLYLISSSPFRNIEICGYFEMGGVIMDIAMVSDFNDLHILTLSHTKESSEEKGGDIISYMTVPLNISEHAKEYWQKSLGQFNSKSIKIWTSRLENFGFGLVVHPNTDIYLFCANKPSQFQKLQIFKQDHHYNIIKSSCLIESGHSLKGSLILSHKYDMLASISDDGTLSIRSINNPNQMQIIKTHHYWKGKRGKHFCFSSDDSKIIIIGEDCSIICYKIEKIALSKAKDEEKHPIEIIEENKYGLSISQNLSELYLKKRNASTRLSTFHVIARKALEKNTLLNHPTWLETLKKNKKELEIQTFSEEKSRISSEIAGMQLQIEELIEKNELFPEESCLSLHQFTLEPKAITDLQDQIQIRMNNAAKELQETSIKLEKDIETLKAKYWDNMEEKGVSLKGFYDDLKVENYPLSKQSEDLREFEWIKWSREMENLIFQKQLKVEGDHLFSTYSEFPNNEEWSGSQRLECGVDCPLLYSQFQLLTVKQKIDQIVLLKDVIYRIKCEFNKKFNEMYKSKIEKMAKIKEKNQRIENINKELELDEKIWTPEWGMNENIYSLFELKSDVSINEVKEVQQSEDVTDNILQEKMKREKILYKLMYGVLEMKKDYQFKMAPELPGFMLNKKTEDFTPDEKLQAKEYKIALDKYKQTLEMNRYQLENEHQELKESIKKILDSFDKELQELEKQKQFTDNVIYQEKLLIANLSLNIIVESELMKWECYIKHKIDEKQRQQHQIEVLIQKAHDLEKIASDRLQELQIQDKNIEMHAKKELKNLYNGKLYTYYKKKPKSFQKYNLTSKQENLQNEFSLSNTKYLQTHIIIDEERPEFVSLDDWEKMCNFQQQKRKIELKIQEQMQAQTGIMQYMKEQQQKLTNFHEEMWKLHAEKNKIQDLKYNLRNNIQIQLILPQGHAEIDGLDVIPDWSKMNLLHITAIDRLNKEIKNIGELKISSLIKSKGVLKYIRNLEAKWNKVEVKMDKLGRYLKKTDRFMLINMIFRMLNRGKVEITNVQREKVLQLMEVKEKLHEKQLKQYQHNYEKINQDIKKLQKQNAKLQKEIENLHGEVTEMELISGNTDALQEIDED